MELKISCVSCGNEYRTTRKTTKFCSDRCRQRYNKNNKGKKKKCNWCQSVFYSYKNRKHCSDICRQRHELLMRTKKQEEKEMQKKDKELTKLVNSLTNLIARTKVCSHCGKEFILQKNVSGHKYCSDECKEDGYRSIRRKRRRKNRINKDTRWKANGKMDYSITLDKLHKRDKGICYLCNELTDYNDFVLTDSNCFVAGNDYPSIDHVLPIAKGGLHTWDNVKLAHRLCNSIKQDKIII